MSLDSPRRLEIWKSHRHRTSRSGLQEPTRVTISFDEDDTPLDEYDPLVTRETDAWEQRKLQALWNTRLNNQDRIHTTKHGCRIFILHAFEDVHYISLHDKDTYYEMVSPLEILAHFAEEIGGLEVTDFVTLIGKLPGYWTSDPRVPQFIMTMEEVKQKVQRAGLPITKNWLAAFATSSLLLANSFPNDRPEWDGKPKDDQTWRAWEGTFNPLRKNLKRKTRLARGEDSFGAASTAQLVHNIVPANNPAQFHRETRVLPQGANLADNFDAHFDNLATAETHGNVIVQGALNHLARSATSQHRKVKKLLAEIKSALPSIGGRNNGGGGGTSAANTTVTTKQKETLNRHIEQLQMAVKRKWIQCGFCSTYGHGVG